MSRLCHAIAWLLMALWVPAVTHCGLETLTAAMDASGCCSHESAPVASADGCRADHCGVFDDGHYRAGQDESLVWPASVHALASAVDVRPGPAVVHAPLLWVQGWPSAPPELARRWMFERRAAPLANAPGRIAG